MGNLDKPLAVRFSSEQRENIQNYARKYGLVESSVVRIAVSFFLSTESDENRKNSILIENKKES